MLIPRTQTVLLVAAIAAARVCLGANILHARQINLCSALVCGDSQDCGGDCECMPLLGGIVGVRTLMDSNVKMNTDLDWTGIGPVRCIP